ncbi:MAG: flagellar biosynthesis protein FlgL, partial [Lachnospiraceae bacterium]|nr:flagellar biosynthesis protein FlgL [Lachnospiraceae bacterium]
MRITNKMMNYDTLSNMNANKTTLDRLNSQMSTEKKIARLSDDPVVGVRALRLRGSLSEVTQYYGANVPDAVAWVDVTQKAIDSTEGILSSMKSLCVQGANGTYEADSRKKIYEELKADVKQIYQNGNANYAGRTVFTGYRTGQTLTFTGDTTADYRGITDRFNASDIYINSYVESPLTDDDINAISGSIAETDVKEDRVNRIRLSYDNLNQKVCKSWLGQ